MGSSRVHVRVNRDIIGPFYGYYSAMNLVRGPNGAVRASSSAHESCLRLWDWRFANIRHRFCSRNSAPSCSSDGIFGVFDFVHAFARQIDLHLGLAQHFRQGQHALRAPSQFAGGLPHHSRCFLHEIKGLPSGVPRQVLSDGCLEV